MPNHKINFAVISLNKEQARNAKSKLENRFADSNKETVDWFRENWGKIYTNNPDNFKPFGDKPINKIITTCQEFIDDEEDRISNAFASQTNLISRLNHDLSNFDTFTNSKISVYFIDVFATFFEKYEKLSNRLDLALAVNEEIMCCCVFPKTDLIIHDFLKKEFQKWWPALNAMHKRGNRFHIATTEDDIISFSNERVRHLLKLINKEFISNTHGTKNVPGF